MGDSPTWICAAFLSMAFWGLGGGLFPFVTGADWEDSMSQTTRLSFFSVGGRGIIFFLQLYTWPISPRASLLSLHVKCRNCPTILRNFPRVLVTSEARLADPHPHPLMSRVLRTRRFSSGLTHRNVFEPRGHPRGRGGDAWGEWLAGGLGEDTRDRKSKAIREDLATRRGAQAL